MTGGLVRTEDEIMPTKGFRSIRAPKLSNSPEQARQEPDPQNTPEKRSTDGDDRLRKHLRHLDQRIMRGLWCSIICHFRKCRRVYGSTCSARSL